MQVVAAFTQTSYYHDKDNLSFRIVTPSTTKNRGSCPILKIPVSATVRQLHVSIANALKCTSQPQETVEAYECNCNLARDLALGGSDSNHVLVIRGKSIVEKLPLEASTVGSLQQALFSKFGQDLETRKRITYHGATQDQHDSRIYMQTPVVSLCSKQRHVPIHARVDLDGSDRIRPQVLDLHTSELPIHPACFDSSVDALGLSALAVDGVVDIFAVLRTSSAQRPILKGKSAIFRDSAHWEPSIAQSDRGTAMFLSSLRVFASILQDMQDDKNAIDAAYYAFDELTQFPPALRCLHLLVSDQTPTVFDCAALSQSMLEILQGYVVMEEITVDSARLFEGSRLVFGFILESAKSLRINSDGGSLNEEEAAQKLRYTSAFHTYNVLDHKTHEPVLHALQTSDGLVEANLFNSLQVGGILANTHLQSFLVQTEADPRLIHFALQSGGTCPEVHVFSLGALKDSYGSQMGVANPSLDINQRRDLLHLAEICGRNNLTVHGPGQLESAIAPCLTFDCNAHLAVYTGEQPCGTPGHSSIFFRPQYGEETIDPSLMEQLIAPIVKAYEEDGSAVFDAFGGAQVRIMQDPEEIISKSSEMSVGRVFSTPYPMCCSMSVTDIRMAVFCVDSSASMCRLTDFSEVNEESDGSSEQTHSLIEEARHNALSLEESKDSLVAQESFGDMIAIIAEVSMQHMDRMTREVLDLFTFFLCSEIKAKTKALEEERGSYSAPVWRTRISSLKTDLQILKALRSGLQVHEEALVQFLRSQASLQNLEAAQRWTWSSGDPGPAVPRSVMIPTLGHDITEVPSHLICPISHALMDDAVEASDGHTYSHRAIQQWFGIKKTSPLHNTPLHDTSLTVKQDVRTEVVLWISGGARMSTSDVISVTFDSRVGSFMRTVSRTTTSRDLYRLAYCGLKAEFDTFQLSLPRFGMLLPNTNETVSSMGLRDSDHITIRIPEDTDPLRITSHGSARIMQGVIPEMCLVKVFGHSRPEKESFAFWVPRDTTDSLASVIWKYWRYRLLTERHLEPKPAQVHTNVEDIGDGWIRSKRRNSTESLAAFLTPDRCTGRLEPENLFSKNASTLASHSSPKVLKILVINKYQEDGDYRLTRLDVLKQMFEALINRMLAYNYKNHVGLVAFSSHAQVVMPISHVLENFRCATNELKGGGYTALWDALALAGDQIEQYASRFPGAKKRVVVISDGMDTRSTTNTGYSIASKFLRKGISVDSVSLGDEDNIDLRTLSYLLGSYCFHPTSLTNALAVCEMEPFLTLSQRPPITLPLQNLTHSLHVHTQFYNSRRHATATLITDDTVPPIREHPNMRDDFKEVTALASNGDVTGAAVTATTGNATGRSTLRVPRLMKEIQKIIARGSHAKYDIYISTADVSFWKVVVEGPDGSPYSDGAFLLYLHADEGYPRLAPKARFVTRIKHPNVNIHGRICHSIFDRDWTSDTSMGAVLDTIYGLLYQPESSDPVNTTTTLEFFHDPMGFAEEAREHAQKHASKTREEWKAEILGE